MEFTAGSSIVLINNEKLKSRVIRHMVEESCSNADESRAALPEESYISQQVLDKLTELADLCKAANYNPLNATCPYLTKSSPEMDKFIASISIEIYAAMVHAADFLDMKELLRTLYVLGGNQP